VSKTDGRSLLRAFTLVELLVVIVIVGVLAAIASSAWRGAQERARSARCAGKLKVLGGGIHLYAQDHDGDFPRSLHSAGVAREPGWVLSVAPYLGVPKTRSIAEWQLYFNRLFRCPNDKMTDVNIPSYGLNVFFELTPDGDDYEGSPATWRKVMQVPTPSRTILLAETRPVAFGDHVMCHQWAGPAAAKNALSHDRHSKMANYLFVDGHVERLPSEATFAPKKGTDLWNPSKANAVRP